MLDGRPDVPDAPDLTFPACAPSPHGDRLCASVPRLEDARAPLALPPPRPEGRAWQAALAAALAGHVGLIALLWSTPDARIGAGGTQLEAIAVEIVTVTAPGSAGTAGDPTPAPPTPLETGALPALPANASSPAPPAKPNSLDATPSDPAPERALAVPLPDWARPTASPDAALIAALATAATSTPPPAAMPPTPMPPSDQPAPAARPALPSSLPATSASPPPAPAAARSAPSAARPGALHAFGREVARLLKGARPRPVQGRGTVTVVFVVATAGGHANARIAASTGTARMERAALTAVESVRFPAPPDGASLADRSFSQDYTFK